MKLTGVVLTKDEERDIKDCLDSLRFCDEVLVIDDYSQDKTVEIAQNLGAKVHQRSLANDFAAQRNFGLKKAKGEWVLFLDADECISKELATEMLEKFKVDNVNGYYLNRLDYFKEKTLKRGETGTIRLLRLANRRSGAWKRSVHEVWDIKGNKGQLRNPITHQPHRNYSDFVKNVNNYSSLHAEENKKEGKSSSMFKIIFFPAIKFLQNWILKLGFLDGTHGFVSATTMSFHSFLSWSKLWLIQKKL